MFTNFLLYSLALLPAVLCGSIGSMATPTYNLTDAVSGQTIQCEMCRPGQYLLKHCSKNSPTECGPCGSQHYTEVWNFIQRCQYCNRFCTANEIESKPCNSTQNRECECKTGYYNLHYTCAKHRVCQAGHGVVLNGTPHTNVKCEKCEEGFFSAEPSSTKACQRFSVCPPASTTILINGKQDVFCSRCKGDKGTPEDQHSCDNDLMAFLASLNLPRRIQMSFQRLLKKKVQEPEKEMPTLLKLYRPDTPTSFGKEMHGILEKINLHDVAEKVENFFLYFPRKVLI